MKTIEVPGPELLLERPPARPVRLHFNHRGLVDRLIAD